MAARAEGGNCGGALPPTKSRANVDVPRKVAGGAGCVGVTGGAVGRAGGMRRKHSRRAPTEKASSGGAVVEGGGSTMKHHAWVTSRREVREHSSARQQWQRHTGAKPVDRWRAVPE